MDEIKSTFTLDASQTLAALNQLDSHFAKLQQTMQNMASSMQSFNAQAAKMGAAAQGSLNQTTQATERLTTSMGLLSRIAFTQAVVRGLSTLRNTFEDTTDEAIKFQNQLGLIQTLAPDKTIGALSAEVRQLSDAFNVGLSDIANAKLAAIGNGFTSAAQQTDVLTASFKFAKSTGADAAASLDLITGVLNSYGLRSDQAEQVAARLFRTMDLGRVTGANLARDFGKVASVSAVVGVSLEEVAAQFAALTISGQSSAESATQISAVISSLIKPSDAAKEAMSKLGFSSAETAIKTLGLQGTLKGLIGTTDGSAEAIARIFPNVRALRDVMRTVPNDATLSRFLDQIQGTDAGKLNQIFDRKIATDAEVLTSEVTKLKNALVVDLGGSLVSISSNFIRAAGGADNLTASAKAFGPVLATGTALLGTYAAAAFTGATANAAFAASFPGVAAGLLLAAGAAVGGNAIGNSLVDAIEAPEKAFDAAQKRIIQGFKASEVERLTALQAADDKRLESSLRTVQRLNQAYLQDVQNAEAAGKALVRNADRTADDVIKSREKFAQSLERASADSRNLSRDSAGRVAGLLQRNDDRRFDRSIQGRSDPQQSLAIAQRAADLANRAAADLAKAAQLGDRAGIGQALNLFGKAQSLGENAQQIAQRTGNRALEARAASNLESITNRQIEAEKRLQAIQGQRQAALDTLNQKQLKALDFVREQTDIIKANSKIVDGSGKLLPEDVIAKQAGAVQAALAKIRNSGLSQRDLQTADAAGLGEQARNFNLKLAQQTLQLDFDVTGGIQRIQGQLQQSFQNFKVKLGFDVGALEQAVGRSFKSPDEVARGLDEVKKKAADLRQSFSQATSDDQNIQRLRTELLGINAALETIDRGALRLAGIVKPADIDLVSQLNADLDKLTRSGAVSSKALEDFFGRIEQLKNSTLAGSVATNIGVGLDLNDLARAAGLLKELQSVQQSQLSNPALQSGAAAQLQGLESIIRNLEASSPAAAFQSASAAIGQGVEPSAAIADNFSRAASAAERLAAASGGVKTLAAGGTVSHFATGGQAKGTDTVAAMLTPGEFVVNARSSAKFFSQLQAINAGQAPSVNNRGGDTIHVGDINVSGASDPKATAREVMKEIRREQRRGTDRI